MIDSLVEKLEKKVVLADGAMGTYFSQKYMTEMEAEEANIATPERIIAIHKEYIEAGAELIRTNTFAVNHGLFAEAERRKEVIEAAVANAREAVRQSRKEVVVAASVGPIRQSAEEEDGEIWKEYTQMLDVFYTLGIRVFLFETFSELRWLPKLAKYCKNKEEQTVVIAELALNPMGYTQHGFGMTEILQELTSDVNFDIVGFNCGVGALHMKKLLQSQKFPKEFLLSVFSNAGYQQEMQGRTQVFHDTAYYAGQMKEILALGANLVGGCCGTTPGHIRALKKVVQNQEQVWPKKLAKENENLGEVKDNPTPFIRKLRGGKKVFVVELDAPFDASSDKFRKGVCALQENGVDIITVSDSPMARARADASLLAVYAKKCADVEIMPHVAMRDRNLIGLRSEILGAHVNGIRDFLVITGDPVGSNDRGKITGVFDVNSIRFMEYLKHMNEEVLQEEPVYYGGALNYAGVNPAAIAGRMKKKMEAGCEYFLTQPIFTEEDIDRIRELKEMTGARILCGIMPLVSYRNAMFMKNEMPGIHVSDEIVSRYQPDMSKQDAEEVAVKISLKVAEQLLEVADGFYLMTPFHRVALVNRIIDGIRKLLG